MSKKCKCKLISFGHVNLYILLILLGAAFDSAKYIIINKSAKLGQSDPKKPENQHPIIITINYAMGLCCSFIFFIIYKKCNKGHKTTNIFLLDNMMNKTSYNKEITNKEKFLWILLGSTIDFIANIINSYNWIKNENYLCYWSSNILIMSLFSYLLLKMKLYRHHYTSIIIITIFGIAHNFVYGNFKIQILKENYKGYIIYFFIEGTFNILYVIYKFFMIKKSIKSYEILFFQGLIELILGIIALSITTKFCPEFDSFFIFFNDINGKEIFRFVSLIFINFLTFLIIFIIIDIFTAFHIFLLNIISEIIICLADGIFTSDFEYIIIIYTIFLIISIFMVLVFIEIIHLNFCGLSYMTKKNIEERARLDTMLIDDNDIYNDDNNDENKENIIKNNDDESINLGSYNVELKEFSNSESYKQILS